MLCNSAFILTVLFSIIVIGIIINFYSNGKINNKANNNLDTNTNKNKNKTNTVEHFTAAQEAEIVTNNNTINNLIADLNDKQKLIVQKNLDADTVEKTLTDDLQKTINNITTQIKDSSTMKDSKALDNLDSQITDLENKIYNNKMENANKTEVARIKSLNNGLELKLTKTPNTYFTDASGLTQAAHMVNLNNGCLSIGPTDYDVYKCNDKNPKQYFKIQNILNDTDYARNIDISVPFDGVDLSKVQYPFAMIKSINNGNCLTNNHGNLTVQPCYSYVAQRWMPL
jgi:hypothetical protein